jgi:TRAP-type C4-dicarboxylate transport system substrate-binding protein
MTVIRGVVGALTLMLAVSASARQTMLTAGTESNKDGLYCKTLTLLADELKKTTKGQVGLKIYPNPVGSQRSHAGSV